MTPFEKFLEWLKVAHFDPWLLLKGLFLVGLFIYLVFAGMVIRQVNLMSRVLDGGFKLPLRLLSWLHFLLALGLLILAVVIL